MRIPAACDLILTEEALDLDLGVFDRVGAVDEVFAGAAGIVAADSTGSRFLKLGGAHDDAHALYGVVALYDHGEDGAARHVGDDLREEGLIGDVGIVLAQDRLIEGHHFGIDDFVVLALDAGDDLAHQAALDAVGLEHDIGSFNCHGNTLLILLQILGLQFSHIV